MAQQIAGLALQSGAYLAQCVKTDAFDFAGFEQGQIGFRNANLFCQISGSHFSSGQHQIEFNDDWHQMNALFSWSVRCHFLQSMAIKTRQRHTIRVMASLMAYCHLNTHC